MWIKIIGGNYSVYFDIYVIFFIFIIVIYRGDEINEM